MLFVSLTFHNYHILFIINKSKLNKFNNKRIFLKAREDPCAKILTVRGFPGGQSPVTRGAVAGRAFTCGSYSLSHSSPA